MEQAFAARHVDELIMGDWEEVQVEWGLLSPEEADRQRESRVLPQTSFSPTPRTLSAPASSAQMRREREEVHKKARHKMAKASRKKNRKR
jgi:hypothetical protein